MLRWQDQLLRWYLFAGFFTAWTHYRRPGRTKVSPDQTHPQRRATIEMRHFVERGFPQFQSLKALRKSIWRKPELHPDTHSCGRGTRRESWKQMTHSDDFRLRRPAVQKPFQKKTCYLSWSDPRYFKNIVTRPDPWDFLLLTRTGTIREGSQNCLSDHRAISSPLKITSVAQSFLFKCSASRGHVRRLACHIFEK